MYKGSEAKIPLGDYGLLTDAASDKLPPNALIDAKNIVALTDYWPNTTAQRLIVATSDGSIYRDIGGRNFVGGTAITTGLGNLKPNCQFVTGGQESGGRGKKLFFFSYGLNQLKVLADDGVVFNSVTTPSVDWTSINYPKCGIIHRSRLWAFAGQLAYASDTADHTNFNSNYLAIAVYPGEGGDILGCFVYKTKLFVFKEGGYVYILNDTDTASANWYWQKVANNIGISSPNAISEVIDTLIFGNASGTLSTLDTSQSTGGFDSGDLLRTLQVSQYFRANANRAGTQVQHALYYPDKKLLFATYRTGYFTYNDQMLVIDFNRQQPRITTWPKGSPNCLALRKGSDSVLRPIYGDASGYIHFMDSEMRLEGEVFGGTGTAYTGSFQTSHTDFSYLDQSLGAKEKHFDWLAVTYVPEGPHLLSCDFFIDGRFVDTVTFPMNQSVNDPLGTFLLGTDRTAQSNTETIIRKLRGTGRTLSVRLYNAGSNQSFQVSSLTVGFRLGAEKVTR